MIDRKFIVAIPVVLVIVVAVIIVLISRGRDIGFKEPPKFLFSISGKGKDALKRPLSIAVSRGKIFVAGGKNGRVQVFSSTGKPLFSFPATPDKDKASNNSYPFGIAVDNREKIYLTELRNQKLMVFNPSGNFISNFPLKKSKALKRPLAVTFANNKLYLTDAGDQKIKIFSLEDKLLLEFGKAGKGKGEFSFPNGIAVAKDGTIFVSDSNNKRIQVFSSKGKFKFAFGEQTFALPKGIAIDWLERVHVADTFGRKILVFDKQGNLLFSYTIENIKSQDEKQAFPTAVAIDNGAKHIYVTDRLNDSISVWGYP